jgi:putative addiction module component (TIGR02574 family)
VKPKRVWLAPGRFLKKTFSSVDRQPCPRTGQDGFMAEDAGEMLTQALKLPPAARAALADSLIDSLDGEVDENAEEAWRSEIALRVRELDSGAVQTIAWDEVRRQLHSRSNG